PDPRPTGEAAIVLALVSPATAQEVDLPVLGYLSFARAPAEAAAQPQARVYRVGTGAPVRLMGAEGAVELASALDLIQRQGGSAAVEWTDPVTKRAFGLTLISAKAAILPEAKAHQAITNEKMAIPPRADTPEPEDVPEEVA